MLDVFGRPMVEYVLMYLAQYGVREVTVNAWHLSEQLRTLPGLAEKYSITLSLSEQPDRFEHGGDLGYAKDFLASLDDDERFIALNADTIFYAPFSEINGLAQQVSAAEVERMIRETPWPTHEGWSGTEAEANTLAAEALAYVNARYGSHGYFDAAMHSGWQVSERNRIGDPLSYNHQVHLVKPHPDDPKLAVVTRAIMVKL